MNSDNLQCSRCKVNLPLEHFNKKRCGNYMKHCKQCNGYMKTYREQNRELLAKKERAYYKAKTPEKANGNYSCNICNITVANVYKTRHLNSKYHIRKIEGAIYLVKILKHDMLKKIIFNFRFDVSMGVQFIRGKYVYLNNDSSFYTWWHSK
jgi:NAD-dependent SIR2 family protein deacetylase